MYQQIAWFVLISPYLVFFLFLGSILINEEEFKYKIIGFVSIILSILYSVPILFIIFTLSFIIIKITIEIISNPYGLFFLGILLFVLFLHFIALDKKSPNLITVLYTLLAISLWVTVNKLLNFIGSSIDFTEFIQILPIYLLTYSSISLTSLLDFLPILTIAIFIIVGFFYVTKKNINFFINILTVPFYYATLWIFTLNFASIVYSSQIVYFPILKQLFTFINFYVSSNLPNKIYTFKTDKGPTIIIDKKIYPLNCVQEVLIKKFRKILCKSINQIKNNHQLTFSSFYIELANISLSSYYLSTISKKEDLITTINLSSIPIFLIAIKCSYPKYYLNYWNPRPLSHKEEIKFLNDLERYCTKN